MTNAKQLTSRGAIERDAARTLQDVNIRVAAAASVSLDDLMIMPYGTTPRQKSLIA
jgi:hypothetical protein